MRAAKKASRGGYGGSDRVRENKFISSLDLLLAALHGRLELLLLPLVLGAHGLRLGVAVQGRMCESKRLETEYHTSASEG